MNIEIENQSSVNLEIGSSEVEFEIGKNKNTNSYKSLTDKPSINGVELVGNKTTEELGIEAGSDVDILTVFDIEYTYEDNEVYNANAIHQLMEIFGYEIMNLVEVIENHEERLSALES